MFPIKLGWCFFLFYTVLCEPTVKLPQGNVIGEVKQSYYGRNFSSFEGIPYAKPPIGELRFEDPQPADPWSGDLYANTTYICMQYCPFPMLKGPLGLEDCLYINVYVPRETITENDKPLDVIVHIHGGAYMLGSPAMMGGPDYIMDKDVVYVTFTYRLGVLGFLSTDDEVVPGNNGLKDQSTALKWIQDNIRYFGGNPESVTITGMSAGAASVHLHYLSQWSRGLFHRGFSQSGNALLPWTIVENPMSKTKVIAEGAKCNIASTTEMIKCLKEKPVKTLVQTVSKLYVVGDAFPPSPFGPVIEKSGKTPFLPEHPYKIISDGKLVNDVPWVTSNVKNEGLFAVEALRFVRELKRLFKHWNQLIPHVMDYYNTIDESSWNSVTDTITKYYFNGDVSTENLTALEQLCSDRYFFADTYTALKLHSEHSKSPVYYYLMSYVLEQPSMFGTVLRGIMHSDDGKLIFKMIGTPDEFPKNDEMMKDFLVDFLYEFASTGVAKFGGKEWKPFDKDMNCMLIESPTKIGNAICDDMKVASEFWTSLNLMENEKIFK